MSTRLLRNCLGSLLVEVRSLGHQQTKQIVVAHEGCHVDWIQFLLRRFAIISSWWANDKTKKRLLPRLSLTCDIYATMWLSQLRHPHESYWNAMQFFQDLLLKFTTSRPVQHVWSYSAQVLKRLLGAEEAKAFRSRLVHTILKPCCYNRSRSCDEFPKWDAAVTSYQNCWELSGKSLLGMAAGIQVKMSSQVLETPTPTSSSTLPFSLWMETPKPAESFDASSRLKPACDKQKKGTRKELLPQVLLSLIVRSWTCNRVQSRQIQVT